MAILFEEFNETLAQFIEIVGHPVGQVSVLRLRPHELHWIKFWRIRRQPVRLEPRASSAFHLCGGGSVSIQPVPNNPHRSPQAAVHGSKKSHQINCVTVMVQDFVIQAEAVRPGGDRQCTDYAQAVVPIPWIVDGSLSDRSPDLASQRLQKEAAFVEKNDASFPLGPLFLAGATHPAAIVRSQLRHILSHGVRASARSSQVGAEACRRSRRDSVLETAPRSPLAPADNSTPESGSPNDLRRAPTLPINVDARPALIVARGHDADFPLTPIHRLVQAPFSSALQKKYWLRPPQPLSPVFPPAQEAGLRFDGELPTLRGCHKVSCKQLYAHTQGMAH